MEKEFDSKILRDEQVIEFVSNRLVQLALEDDPSIEQCADFLKILARKSLIKISEYSKKIIEDNLESIVGESVLELIELDK